MKSLLAIFSVLLLISTVKGESLDLEHLLKLAMQNNRAISVLQSNLREKEAVIDQARAAYLPQFSLEGSYKHISRTPELSFSSIPLEGIPEDFRSLKINLGSKDLYESRLDGFYLLYDWGKRNSRVQQANLVGMITGGKLSTAKQQVAYQVIKTYATVSLLNSQVLLSENFVELAQQHLEDAGTLYDNGLISEFELLKSELQLKIYQEKSIIASSQCDITLNKLSELCGEEFEISEFQFKQLSLKDIKKIPEEKFDSLILQKPEISIRSNLTKVSELEISKQSLRPTLAAIISAGWRNNYMPDTDKILFNFLGGVKFSFPIYDGGFSRNKKREEKAKQESYKREMNRISSESKRELIILQQQAIALIATLDVSKEKLELARKAVEIANVAFQEGLITNSDFLDSQQELEKIENEILLNKFNILINELDKKVALGFFPEIKFNYSD